MAENLYGADLLVEDLDAGNAPIIEHAAKLFASAPDEQETVTFTVSYVEGDQKRGGAPSTPDTLTVDRDGTISAGAPNA